MLPDGTSVLLVRVHGRVSAFVDRCPHQRVPLNLPEGDFLEALPLSIDAEGNIHLASE